MQANLAAPWYATGLRTVAEALTGLAERLERAAPAQSEPRLHHFSADDFIEETRHRLAVGAHRLSQYY